LHQGKCNVENGFYQLNTRGDLNQIFDLDGEALDLDESLKYVNHSPAGFSWGYRGSGYSQASFAILYDYTGNPILSRQLYQALKVEFIAGARRGNHYHERY
jgi:hypothetical protein